VERANPTYLSFERGKPGGEGEGQYMPPLIRHRSTIGLKVARPWAGLLRPSPHGAFYCGLTLRFAKGGVPGSDRINFLGCFNTFFLGRSPTAAGGSFCNHVWALNAMLFLNVSKNSVEGLAIR
jgi:hypothetical protein